VNDFDEHLSLEGCEEGREEKRKIARNLLAKGSTPEFVHEVTGLDMETLV